MQAKEIKTGAIVEFDGAPIIIETLSVQSPSARGAATLYKFRGRNIVTKQKIDITLKGTESLPEADFEETSRQCDVSRFHSLILNGPNRLQPIQPS